MFNFDDLNKNDKWTVNALSKSYVRQGKTTQEALDVALSIAAENQFINFTSGSQFKTDWQFDLSSVDDILSGNLVVIEQNEIPFLCSLTNAICVELKSRSDLIRSSHDRWIRSEDYTNWLNQVDNCLEFLMNNFPAELQLVFIRISISHYRLPFRVTRMKNFVRLHQNVKNLIQQIDREIGWGYENIW